MDKPGKYIPPPFMLTFFRWFCKPEYKEDIEGDLLERFNGRLKIMSLKKAKWLFAKDVLLLFRPGIIRNIFFSSQQKVINMKNINWKKLLTLNILVVLMIVSPFIPGPSNNLVLGLSVAGQLMGTFGLILVPIGLVWTIIEIRKFRKANGAALSNFSHQNLAIAATLLIALAFLLGVVFAPNAMPKSSFFFGLLLILTAFALAQRQISKWKKDEGAISDNSASIILAVSSTACLLFICLLAILAAFVGLGIIPGMAGLTLLVFGLIWAVKQISKMRKSSEIKFNRLPLYFLTIPLTGFLAFMFIMKPASNFSRNFVIKRSETLIASIEDYKMKTGRYPESINNLHPKPTKPFIMGIGDFRYNKINGNYSLSFSQWIDLGSLEEIVLYDKNNLKNSLSGEFAKYDYNFDLHRVKSAFESYETGYDHWRYYWAD